MPDSPHQTSIEIDAPGLLELLRALGQQGERMWISAGEQEPQPFRVESVFYDKPERATVRLVPYPEESNPDA